MALKTKSAIQLRRDKCLRELSTLSVMVTNHLQVTDAEAFDAALICVLGMLSEPTISAGVEKLRETLRVRKAVSR